MMEKIAGKAVGSSVYLWNNYSYNKDNRSECIYRCNTRRTTRCRGAIMYLGDGTIKLLKPHNHSKVFHRGDHEKMKNEMRQMCRETLIPPKQIFDDVCRKYPDAACTLSYSGIKTILFRERRKNYPQIPTNLTALAECIGINSFMKDICKIVIKDENDKVAILFSTETLLQILNMCHTIYADGTFSVLPSQPPIAQLYIIHIQYMDTGVGTVFILCEALTKAMYTTIWSKIKELTPMLQENLKFTMTDYEAAAMVVLEQQFPSSIVKGCWFHYNQALLRKWRHLGLADAPTKVLSMAMTLALLAADLFIEGFLQIEREAESLISEYPAIRIFIEYVRSTWLPKAEKVSVHGCHTRTNNITESYNNIVSLKMGKLKMNIWVFLGKLEQLIMDEEIKLKRLNAGQSVRRESNKKTIIRNRKIETIQRHLANRRLSLKEFLLSFHKGNKILIYGDNEENEIINNAALSRASLINLEMHNNKIQRTYQDTMTGAMNLTPSEENEEQMRNDQEVEDKEYQRTANKHKGLLDQKAKVTNLSVTAHEPRVIIERLNM